MLKPTEIQYLRGLVWSDRIKKDYKSHPEAKIDRFTSMHEFTEKILDKLDQLEDLR